MAACVRGSDAYPQSWCSGGSSCMFELKNYKYNSFTCSVCMMKSFDTEMYRCNDCGKARHKGCIQLPKNILTGPGPSKIFGGGASFTLSDHPKRGSGSANKKWAEYCLVCGMAVKHYSYHRHRTEFKADLNMHPCCAELVRPGNHPPYKLTLEEKPYCVFCAKELPPGASPHGPRKYFCWSYIVSKDIRVHVDCYTKMVIKALESINPSDQNDDGKIRIVLKRRKDSQNNWKTLDKAIEIGLSLAGVDATQILINLILM